LAGWPTIVRERMHGNVTYFNVNRHINPDQRLRGLLQALRLRQAQAKDPTGYTMALEEAWHAPAWATPRPVTEFHIVGGLHPELTVDYFSTWCAASNSAFPKVHIKAFTMVEIAYFAKRAKLSYRGSAD
jgi:aminodeoxyfutalosine synthase